MKSRFLPILCSILLLPLMAGAWEDGEIKFPGTINGWDLDASSAAKYTGPDGFHDWFRYTAVAGDTTAMGLKLVAANWDNQWGGSSLTKNQVGDMYWYSEGTPPDSTVTGGMTSGFYYVFTARDPGVEADTRISVMELSGEPAFITEVSGGNGTFETNAEVNITITFNANPPPEQKAYVRYTTDGWTTSRIVPAELVGNTATATLSELAAGTTYEWYALSSTATSNTLATGSGQDVDFLSLSWANNNGRNYHLSTPGDAAWVWHNNNRVVYGGSNVQFWVKVGYANSDGSGKWIDNAAVYYTTDGSEPSGDFGTGNGSTMVRTMDFDHTQADPDPRGHAMWWFGTVSNLNIFGEVKYRIGVWHDNGPERFADYQAGTDEQTFSFRISQDGEPELYINGVPGNYTTTKFFIDEVAGDTKPLQIVFRPNAGDPLTDVEIFSNLNRRDFATNTYLRGSELVEEGIWPPDGHTINVGDDDRYYKAYAMDEVTAHLEYNLTLHAEKTGAYRLTARYRTEANTNWVWYTQDGRRDHAIVVSPTIARDIVMYEINTLNVNASGPSFAQRSTFEDLHGGDGAVFNNRVNLNYLKDLGVNWLWFQPVHPNHEDGKEINPDTGQPYDLGSPYAVKNFFEIMPEMSRGNTREDAMVAFTNFVHDASEAGIFIMVDAAFNHTAWDAELAELGVELFATNATPTTEIRSVEARFYSLEGNYCDRAFDANSIAVAPDRVDFGKWNDVYDVFFGRYAALVCTEANRGAYNNEEDWFDYENNWDQITRNVWVYFSEYIPYWLEKTGHPRGTPPEESFRGIDGLRADFGQGLPPQAWEYIINKTRSVKWDFVFMSESLDGGPPTYRSNRHFDILNENIVFALKGATTANAYRDIFEQRRNAYGQGLVLLNNVSHDEENYVDPWEALIRYAAASTIDGAPMIFYGQELGISRTWGFSRYELNFGKMIPHFKTYNSMEPVWQDSSFGNLQLYPVYAAINRARHQSPALRSSNRYFLNQTDGSVQQNIHSVAKYEAPNASPAISDVVFGFVNLDRSSGQSGHFNVNIEQNGQNLFGIQPGRLYNVKNLAAYTNIETNRADTWLWVDGNGDPEPRTGQDILDHGLFVSLNQVPTTEQGWEDNPYEAQYLQVFDVTPPDAPGTPANATTMAYTLTNEVEFVWDASDFEGVAYYRLVVGTTPGGNDVFDENVGNVESFILTDLDWNQPIYAQIIPVSTVGIEGDPSDISEAVYPLNPLGDFDGDGMLNWEEDLAGTDPLDSNSVFRVDEIETDAGVTQRHVAFTAQPGRSYRIYYTDDNLTSTPLMWHAFEDPDYGEFTNEGNDPVSHTFIDDESPDTTGGAPTQSRRFYRIEVFRESLE